MHVFIDSKRAAQLRIGVLGGIGPEATSDFYIKLISAIKSRGFAEQNTQLPNIIINSIPAPELIRNRIADSELIPYIDGLKELDMYGPAFIVMVCNTIHLFHNRLQSEIDAPIINLVSEMRKHISSCGIESIAVIGTPMTVNSGLYRFDNIEYSIPTKKETAFISKAIHRFSAGKPFQQDKPRIEGICKRLIDSGAERVILGCTELALILQDSKLPKINTIDVLVESTLSACGCKRLKAHVQYKK